MKIVSPSAEILALTDEPLKLLELAGRTCYKSEDLITKESALVFVDKICRLEHESVLEHASMTARFVCDRGVSHELVRHRLCSFSQESTRYCNYSKDKFGNEITVVRPPFWPATSALYRLWEEACLRSEEAYFALLASGASPQEARAVLPNSLKTEIVVTANLREWRHIFKLRCSPKAHPQMREIMQPFRERVRDRVPLLFEHD
jgi:thymidylate synthase (FAD)